MRQKEWEFWKRIMRSNEPRLKPEVEGNLLHAEQPALEGVIGAGTGSSCSTPFPKPIRTGTLPMMTNTSIQTLPPEMLISIFDSFAPADPLDFYGGRLSKFMRLSQVCREWRALITEDMPKAWSIIYAGQKRGIVQLVELWLIRTGDSCPLNLTLRCGDYPDTTTILIHLLSYIDRWHSIDYTLPFDCVSILSTATPRNLVAVDGLYLYHNLLDHSAQEQVWDAFNRSKKLQRVKWRDIIPQSTPWIQIEDASLNCDNIQLFQNALPRFTRLTKLSVQFRGHRPPLQIPRATLPLLRSLYLAGSFSMSLLNYIVTPSLQNMSATISSMFLYVEAENCLLHLTRFLEHSTPPLSRLRLFTQGSPSGLHLSDFLQQSAHNLKSLRTLELGFTNLQADTILLLSVSPSPQVHLLPSLQSLSLRGGVSAADGLLGSMIQSRFLHGSLQDIKLCLHNFQRIHKRDALVFQSLKEEGREVRFSAFEDRYQ